MKLCVGASAGGHMNQLLRLLEHSSDWNVEPRVFLTTHPALAETLRKRGKTYDLGECNRDRPLRIVLVALRALWFALRERPTALVTTGSLPVAIACLWCKLLGTKIVWIDSIANTEELSMSGKLMRRVADLFLTQWPGVADKYDDVEFAGQIV